ncbi:MAG TPA: sulfatase-like hydrolase/transferase, partial [Tepidisphaeraceae bacterium]|nr:sulfatase-like hydrolase/transferase [Tepidisphaeraceae bacterium]
MQVSAVSLAAMSVLGAAPSPTQRRRPNVLLIFLDDLGSIDLNCYGATDLETPNFDALAASGLRFTQFYSASPICSASRGGTLTGRYPQRNGLTDNASSEPGIGAALPASERTIAAVLKDAGYATGHVGKWHMGYTPDTIPTAH